MTSKPTRRWELTEAERERVAEARRGPARPLDLLRAVAAHPRLLPGIAKSAVAGAVDGVRAHSGLYWVVDAQRVRRVVPDAAQGAGFSGERVLLDALLAHVGTGARVVDVGAGGGRVARHVAPLVRELVCVDVSPAMIEEARENLAGHSNVSFFENRGFTLAGLPDAAFDAAYSHDVLLQLDPFPVLALVDEARRVLRPGGVFVGSFYTIARPAWARRALELARAGAPGGRYGATPERPYTEDQIRAWYEAAGLTIVDERYGESDDPEQPVHYVVTGRA